MDPPLVNEASFTAASNPSSYSLLELLSFPAMDGGGPEESTVTGQSGGKRIHSCFNDDNDCSVKGSKNGGGSKIELEGNSGTSLKLLAKVEEKEKGKDYVHVRARRGQATDSHSLAERARREKISERMKILQDLVPGCNKVIGKALVLDEIINYIQSLQRQVEFLSMKLEAVNSRLNPTIEGFPPKDLATPSFDSNAMIFGSQVPREYSQGTPAEWLHMQVGNAFERRAAGLEP